MADALGVAALPDDARPMAHMLMLSAGNVLGDVAGKTQAESGDDGDFLAFMIKATDLAHATMERRAVLDARTFLQHALLQGAGTEGWKDALRSAEMKAMEALSSTSLVDKVAGARVGVVVGLMTCLNPPLSTDECEWAERVRGSLIKCHSIMNILQMDAQVTDSFHLALRCDKSCMFRRKEHREAAAHVRKLHVILRAAGEGVHGLPERPLLDGMDPADVSLPVHRKFRCDEDSTEERAELERFSMMVFGDILGGMQENGGTDQLNSVSLEQRIGPISEPQRPACARPLEVQLDPELEHAGYKEYMRKRLVWETYDNQMLLFLSRSADHEEAGCPCMGTAAGCDGKPRKMGKATPLTRLKRLRGLCEYWFSRPRMQCDSRLQALCEVGNGMLPLASVVVMSIFQRLQCTEEELAAVIESSELLELHPLRDAFRPKHPSNGSFPVRLRKITIEKENEKNRVRWLRPSKEVARYATGTIVMNVFQVKASSVKWGNGSGIRGLFHLLDVDEQLLHETAPSALSLTPCWNVSFDLATPSSHDARIAFIVELYHARTHHTPVLLGSGSVNFGQIEGGSGLCLTMDILSPSADASFDREVVCSLTFIYSSNKGENVDPNSPQSPALGLPVVRRTVVSYREGSPIPAPPPLFTIEAYDDLLRTSYESDLNASGRSGSDLNASARSELDTSGSELNLSGRSVLNLREFNISGRGEVNMSERTEVNMSERTEVNMSERIEVNSDSVDEILRLMDAQLSGSNGMNTMSTTNGMNTMSTTNGMNTMSTTNGMNTMSTTNGMNTMSTTNGMNTMSTTNGVDRMSRTNGMVGMSPSWVQHDDNVGNDDDGGVVLRSAADGMLVTAAADLVLMDSTLGGVGNACGTTTGGVENPESSRGPQSATSPPARGSGSGGWNGRTTATTDPLAVLSTTDPRSGVSSGDGVHGERTELRASIAGTEAGARVSGAVGDTTDDALPHMTTSARVKLGVTAGDISVDAAKRPFEQPPNTYSREDAGGNGEGEDIQEDAGGNGEGEDMPARKDARPPSLLPSKSVALSSSKTRGKRPAGHIDAAQQRVKKCGCGAAAARKCRDCGVCYCLRCCEAAHGMNTPRAHHHVAVLACRPVSVRSEYSPHPSARAPSGATADPPHASRTPPSSYSGHVRTAGGEGTPLSSGVILARERPGRAARVPRGSSTRQKIVRRSPSDRSLPLPPSPSPGGNGRPSKVQELLRAWESLAATNANSNKRSAWHG